MNAVAPPIDLPYVICNLDDIPSRRAKAFQLLRRDADGNESVFSIFVVRWGSQVFGYVNQCPHTSVNLDWERNQFLDPSGLRLMCGKHGALFEIGTGRCVDGPCRGERLAPVKVSVLDGDICITGVELVEAEEAPASDAEGAEAR
jgi:nitrite reductase/ring-hydroxylating ferredoxin subunit